MRHGEVTYFDRSGPLPSPTEVVLNDDGREQAAAAAVALAGVALDRVVTSGLARTDQTAAIVVGDRELDIERHADLEEIAPGLTSGVALEEVGQAIARGFSGPIDRETQFLGGESYGAFLDRVLPCWGRLIADQNWKTMLVVTHGGVNRAILAHVLGSGLSGFGALEQDPAAINIIDVDDAGSGLVRLVNFTAYNPLKQGWHLTTMERLFVEYVELRQSFESPS
jgi:probable phosphoglycerate mutase